MDFICSYAQTLVCEQFPDFKASRGWLSKFMKRHNLSLRAKTSMAQKLPTQLDQHIEKFTNYLRTTREEEEIYNDMILNMDETPVFFDTVPNKTVDIKGTKTVKVRTTRSEKRHVTLVLTVTASGEMLPPMVIFKGKRTIGCCNKQTLQGYTSSFLANLHSKRGCNI